MELKLDVKTLIIGIAVGVIITAAIGAGVGSADVDRFGIAIEQKGSALVRTSEGDFYVVNPDNGMATRVLTFRDFDSKPDDSRSTRGSIFSISGARRPERASGTGKQY